jgi:hypothetical protein
VTNVGDLSEEAWLGISDGDHGLVSRDDHSRVLYIVAVVDDCELHNMVVVPVVESEVSLEERVVFLFNLPVIVALEVSEFNIVLHNWFPFAFGRLVHIVYPS